MANEIVKTRSTKSAIVVVPEFKQGETVTTIADEPRRIKISVRNGKKKDGSTFKIVKGFVKLECFDEDGNSEGVKVRKLDVHFTKVAFKGAMNVHSPEELKSGYLYVRAKGLQLPPRYQVTIKQDENGNDMFDEEGRAILKYPEIWIKSDIIGLEEFVTSQDALDVDEDVNIIPTSINEETGEVEYTEETGEVEDTEETIIK